MNHEHAGGLNAINYQGDALQNDLAQIIETLIEKKQFNQKGFEKSRLCAIIKDRTGINLTPEIVESPIANAAVMPPYLNPNHSFFNTFTREVARDYFSKDLDKLKGDKEGWVDRKTGKVGGFYSEMPGTLYVYTGIKDALDPQEIAAVILHEYGHGFNYFDGINDRFHDMSVISRAISEANQIKDTYKRRDIITYAMKKVKVHVNDPDELTTTRMMAMDKVDDLVWSMYIDGSVRPSEQFGDKEYNWRANEQLADQFAVMHGAGPYLASGLRKVVANPFNKYTSSKGAFIFTEVLKTLFLCFPPTAAFVLLYLYADEENLTYDELPKRIKLMRQHLIAEIDANYNNQRIIRRLKEDIDFIKQVEASIYERKTLYDHIQNAIVPRIRRLNKQTTKNTTIENLINNDLFIGAIETKR